ncbi:hypothetical protein DNTS_025674 [Danionella cerebrum]|uniref:NADH dehydrogenase [ubiquinone] 1 alpha subcomplex assembly factor 2 n=1 Tax=Danionella cerebrum TaxID=2873325 RepID=A0A553QFF0_9TELE|nr:hypothetical protein DNTS_025674 [Danionella translucida]
MNRVASLWRRIFVVTKEHVGTDLSGNKYYFIPEQKTWTAWIRGKRKHPPSMEEQLNKETSRKQLQIKVAELVEKDKAIRAKEFEEGLVANTQVKGHASVADFGPSELKEDPVSSSNTFQPGSWMPQGNKK